MKSIILFHFDACPYCQQARHWITDVFEKHPEYRKVPLTLVDEKKQPAVADQYDYYYVPTFYIDGKKVHEGAASYEIVEDVFRRAYEG